MGPKNKPRQNRGSIYGRGTNKWGREADKPIRRLFSSEEIQKAYTRAFNEGRCFRCLAKDHKKWQCREQARCFKCDGIGHNSGRCSFKKENVVKRQPEQRGKAPEKTQEGQTYAQIVQT